LLPETDGPDQVELLRVVIQDKSSNLEQGDLKPCGHAELAAGIFQRARPAVLQAAQRRIRCDLCEADTDIWLCLTCLGMFCSRENEGHHGVKHYAETGHCVVMSLVSLNFWCYAHEQYLEHDFYPALVPLFRAVHEIKHGEPALCAGDSSVGTRSTSTSPKGGHTAAMANCPHVENSVARTDPAPGFSIDGSCKECGDITERWVCLTCYEVHCGRYANKHMIQHNQQNPGHDVCLNLKDLSIWCQRCQQYLDTFKQPLTVKVFNYFHKLKFKDEDLPEPLTYQALMTNGDFISDLFGDFPIEASASSSSLLSTDDFKLRRIESFDSQL
jgi:hypothetical protein